MNGRVDSARRALIDLNVTKSPTDRPLVVTVWIDTAFDGYLVFSRSLIEQLGLRQEALATAILADGSQVLLESYLCHIEWFGDIVAAQVIANDGKLPLFGTELLATRKLIVDYAAATVSIE